MSETFNTPKGVCPSCGETLDAATDYTPLHPDKHRAPKEQDICVCLYCAEVLEFKADGTLMQAQLLTLLQLRKADHDMLEKTQKLIREKRPKENEKQQ